MSFVAFAWRSVGATRGASILWVSTAMSDCFMSDLQSFISNAPHSDSGCRNWQTCRTVEQVRSLDRCGGKFYRPRGPSLERHAAVWSGRGIPSLTDLVWIRDLSMP